MITSMKIIKRWQCRFGFHRWKQCARRDWANGGYMKPYLYCFPCGKARG